MSDQLQRIKNLRKEAQEAISAHREAVGRLYLPGGIPKYSEGRMREILNHFEGERAKALRSIEEITKEIIVEAGEQIELAVNFPPAAVLDSSERSSAAERLPLVEGDVAGMRTDRLAERLRTVLDGGSKVERRLTASRVGAGPGPEGYKMHPAR